MSLLLDALKKAEKAKDEASRRAQVSGGATADETVLQPRTRDKLLDISRPLEIHSEDIPGRTVPDNFSNPVPDAFSTAPPPRPSQEAPSAPPKAERPANQRAAQPRQGGESEFDTQSAQRAAAKKVFEAKFREPNPKLPFYVTLAVLCAFAVGTVVYFWYQLRPPPPMVNTNPKPPADEKKIDPVPAQAGDKPSAAAALTAAGAIPGLPTQTAPQPPAVSGLPARGTTGTIPPEAVAAPALKPGATPSTPSAKPIASPAHSAAIVRESEPRPPRRQSSTRAAAPTTAENSKLSVNRPGAEINPKIEAGWLAYNRGDLKSARSNYQEMLRDEPSNRDALLGMAAIEVRANRLEQAAIYYQNLLQINPRDPYAQAGLLALRAQITDPVQTESRVKNLLASDPEAQILYFSLGNQYAQQGRWPEAQQAYFKAYTAEPENPDFAYNLAVSLDQVRQPKLALEYYRRAISLAQQRSSSFDQTLARTRAQELAR